MTQSQTIELSFRKRHELHLVWGDTAPDLAIAADEAVRSCSDDVALQAAALCRALRLGEDDDLPSVAEVAWLRAKLEAVTRIAKERGRELIAHFFQPLWTVGVGAGIITSSDDFILVECVGTSRIVIDSTFSDCFEFGMEVPKVPLP